MADAKITALTQNTTPILTDLSVMVDDPSGTPLTQKITLNDALQYLNAPTTNRTINAGYSLYIPWFHEIPSGLTLEIGSGSFFEIG